MIAALAEWRRDTWGKFWCLGPVTRRSTSIGYLGCRHDNEAQARRCRGGVRLSIFRPELRP